MIIFPLLIGDCTMGAKFLVSRARLDALERAAEKRASRRGLGRAAGICRRRLSECLAKNPRAAAIVKAAELRGRLKRLQEVGARVSAAEIATWPDAIA